MSPPDRRRRVRPSMAVAIIAAVVVLVAVIGGLAEVGKGSGPYWQDVDRSYAAQGTVLVDQSNRSGTQLRQLLVTWTGQTRRALEAALDALVRTTTRTARAATAMSPPAPWGGLGGEFATALADRARAVQALRRSVDGLLGMSPLPVSTAGGPTAATGGASSAGSGQLSAGRAADAFSGAGTLMKRGDQAYAAVRRAFERAPGGPRLPASRWVTDPAAWSAGPVLTVVDQLAGSPQLAPVQRVVLLPSAVSVTPAPLPGGQNGASVLPPTRSVIVTVVVADEGNVAERGLPVTAAIQQVGTGVGTRHAAKVSLSAGTSQAVELPPLPVRPGRRYQLTVAVDPPAGEAPGSATSQSFVISVAPSASPPATTTTTQPTKRRTPSTTGTGGSSRTTGAGGSGATGAGGSSRTTTSG